MSGSGSFPDSQISFLCPYVSQVSSIRGQILSNRAPLLAANLPKDPTSKIHVSVCVCQSFMCPCVVSMHVPIFLCMMTELMMLKLKMCQDKNGPPRS